MTPTPCPREETLSLHHDGRLPEDVQQELQAHLQGCAECRRYAQSLIDLDRAITGMVRGAATAPKARSRGKLTRWATALAASAALLALCVGALKLNRSPRLPASATEQHFSLPAPSGGEYAVVVSGEAQLLSIEVNGTSASFKPRKEN